MSDIESLFSFEDVDASEEVIVVDDSDEMLVKWYGRTKRDLPWRLTNNSYGIWVSEIMLQQTKVATVVEYWNKWMATFPTAKHVADASLEDVKSLWAGLGYYRRAENLHKGCIYVVDNHQGKLPVTDVKALLKIPGIGPYTAGAISSIAGGVAVPSVDGNFVRVISRWKGLANIEQNAKSVALIEVICRDLISQTHPGDWNQAIMDIGATICTPIKTDCARCPLKTECKAKSMLEKGEIPNIIGVIPLKKEKVKKREETWTVIVPVVDGERVVMVQRPETGLLAGMWEFPNSVSPTVLRPKKKTRVDSGAVATSLGLPSVPLQPAVTVTHQFTHIDCTLLAHRTDLTAASVSPILASLRSAGTEPVILPVDDITGQKSKHNPVSEQMRKVLKACL